MAREILHAWDLEVLQSIPFDDGDRLVNLAPYATPLHPFGQDWPNIELANHNVFRLNGRNGVVWQVRRVELPGAAPWPQRHLMARQRHRDGVIDRAYTAQGFLDPFAPMALDESTALAEAPSGVWRAGCRLQLFTRWWRYELDPRTGLAICSGERKR